MRKVIIKYGGNAISNHHALDDFAKAIAALKPAGIEPIVVHGGGPQINYWLDKTLTTSHFVDGQRYTDQAALDVIEMVLCGHVNKAIVRALLRAHINAVGISGEDGGLTLAALHPDLGAVGTIEAIQPKLIYTLIDGGFTPVVAPLGYSNKHNALNVNADYSAAHLAAALNADAFILMTNVAGLLDREGKRIAHANTADINALIDNGTIHGGMLPKVDCALTALQGGCHDVYIIDGRTPETLIEVLLNPDTIGTRISA